MDQDLAVSPKKSLTLCIAHYLNTKQDSGWVATLAGYGPAKLRLERAVTLPIRPQDQTVGDQTHHFCFVQLCLTF